MRHPTTWCVVADGGHARLLLKRDGQDVFDIQRELVSAEIHDKTHDLGAERPGRVHESAGAARHAIEPRQDLHRTDKQNFMGEIARILNEANAQHAFDRLILVAPAHALAWLNDALDDGTKQKVAGELQKDLTGVPHSKLREYLPDGLFGPPPF